MPKVLPRNPTVRLLLILGVIFVFMVGGYFGARRLLWPMVKNWRERRANAVAHADMEKGDYTGAMLAIHKTISYNRTNADAWRLAVEIAEKQGTRDLYTYQQELANVEPTFANRLKFIQIAAKFHAFEQADKMVKKIGAEGSQSAEFLELAASVSRRLGNSTAAKYYLMSLIAVQPNNNKARLDLAQIRLNEGIEVNKPSIRAEIRNLATDSELRPRALGMLLNDALQQKDSADSLSLAESVEQLSDLAPTTRILPVEAYRRYAPGRFKPALERVEKEFAGSADKVIILTTYLVSNGLSAENRSYIESLDPKVRDAEGVQLSYAYALLTLRDWNALESFLRNCKWTENEYARYALLAFRYRIAGRDRDFNEAWRLAVIEVGNDAHRLQTLLAQVSDWGWQDQKYELVWKRFMQDPSNQSDRSVLMIHERSKQDTGALNRLFGRILELTPGDLDAKNNYAYTSMLLGINLDAAYADADEVSRAQPHNPYYATTQAFALYRQGKVAEALQTIQSLDGIALSAPERAMMQANILIANGKFEEGAVVAAQLKMNSFLPEERRLLESSLARVDKSREQKGTAAQVAALNSNEPAGSERKGFLRLAVGPWSEKPTVQMQLADSQYSSGDYKSLIESIKSDHWDEADFLRLAILSFAQGKLSQFANISRQAWQTAVALAGRDDLKLKALESLAHEWNWTRDYIDLMDRRFERDPSDNSAFQELVDYYTKGSQTAALARIYQLHLDGNPSDASAKSLYAYYSLLINSNVSRAYTLAKESYDASPDDKFTAKVYAFSLYKQSRGSEAAHLLETFPSEPEKGILQLSFLRAALAAQQNQFKEAREILNSFDASSALPEEVALADSLAKTIAQNTST